MDRYNLKVSLSSEAGEFLNFQLLKEELTLSEFMDKVLLFYKKSLPASPDEV